MPSPMISQEMEEYLALRKKHKRRPTTLEGLAKKKIPAPKWIIPGFLPEGVTLLGAREKSKKSFLVLNIGLALARGQDVLGKLKADGGDVLYFNLEQSYSELVYRLKSLTKDFKSRISFFCREDGPTSMDQFRDDSIEWIEQAENPKLIILDTMSKIGLINEPTFKKEYDRADRIRTWSKFHGVAVIVVCHLIKGDGGGDPFSRFQGYTGLYAASDCAWVLEGKQMHVQGNMVKRQTIPLEWVDDGPVHYWRIL